MKIGNPADKPLVAPPGPNPQAPAAPATPVAGASPSSAPVTTVALSPTATSLLTGGVSGEFDADKVARISQAIAQGTFTVNPEAIADKLIANAQELLSRPPR